MITANITAELVKWWCTLQTSPSQHTTQSTSNLGLTSETQNFPSDLHCSKLWVPEASATTQKPILFIISRPVTVVHMLPTHTALWCDACNLTTHNIGNIAVRHTATWQHVTVTVPGLDYHITVPQKEKMEVWSASTQVLGLVTEYATTAITTANYSQHMGFPQWYCWR